MKAIAIVMHAKRHIFEYCGESPTRITMSQFTKEMLCLVAPIDEASPNWFTKKMSRSEMAKKPLRIVGLEVLIDKTVADGHGRVGNSDMEMDVVLIPEEGHAQKKEVPKKKP